MGSAPPRRGHKSWTQAASASAMRVLYLSAKRTGGRGWCPGSAPLGETQELDTDCSGPGDAPPVNIRKKTGACLLGSAGRAVGRALSPPKACLTMNPRLGIFMLGSTGGQVNVAVGGSQTLIQKASGFLIHKPADAARLAASS